VSASGPVQVEAAANGIRVLTIDRPPVNALGRELVDALGKAATELREDRDARCLIVRSGGSHFCAGADLKERLAMSQDEVRAFVPKLAGACSAFAAIPYPTIAAVRGTAAGGGCELALACDLRLLAEDAHIGLRETALAILPGAGGTQRLARIAGISRAKRWIFTAKMHRAATRSFPRPSSTTKRWRWPPRSPPTARSRCAWRRRRSRADGISRRTRAWRSNGSATRA
jgi:methylglutaconyl-CoA hydratase